MFPAVGSQVRMVPGCRVQDTSPAQSLPCLPKKQRKRPMPAACCACCQARLLLAQPAHAGCCQPVLSPQARDPVDGVQGGALSGKFPQLRPQLLLLSMSALCTRVGQLLHSWMSFCRGPFPSSGRGLAQHGRCLHVSLLSIQMNFWKLPNS